MTRSFKGGVKMRLCRLFGLAFLMLGLSFLSTAFAENIVLNAASIYNQSVADLNSIPKGFRVNADDLICGGWSEKYLYLKDILAKNQKAVAKFKEAANLQYCDFTFGKAIEKSVNSSFPIRFELLEVLRLVMIEARLFESENKYDLALNDYIVVLRFENHLNQQKDFVMLSNIMAIVAQNVVSEPLAQYINRKELSVQECLKLLDELNSLRKNRAGLDKAFEEEKEIYKNTIRMLGEQAKRDGYYVDSFFQKMYKEFDERQEEFSKYLIAAYKENKPNIYNERIIQFENEVKKEAKFFNVDWESIKGFVSLSPGIKTPELIAKIIFVKLPSYSKNINSYYIALSKFNVLLTAVAVKLYEIKNAKAPDDLQMLLPEYLSEIPEDPFNNFSPLKFERKDSGWVVYSLGPDKQDNHATIIYGGREKDRDAEGDIVFISKY